MTTPEQNAQQIAANTQAIAGIHQAMNFLVTEFIRPNAQQHQQSLERLERVEGIVEAIVQRLDETVMQQQANAQQIAQNAEAITQYRDRLEETRQLVAKNSADIAQSTTRIEASVDRLIEENRAFRESQQSQLAAIIGNGRRIDRLEQQAS